MKDCPKASLLKELQANNIYDPKKNQQWKYMMTPPPRHPILSTISKQRSQENFLEERKESYKVKWGFIEKVMEKLGFPENGLI